MRFGLSRQLSQVDENLPVNFRPERVYLRSAAAGILDTRVGGQDSGIPGPEQMVLEEHPSGHQRSCRGLISEVGSLSSFTWPSSVATTCHGCSSGAHSGIVLI